jgi:hypothetical protein
MAGDALGVGVVGVAAGADAAGTMTAGSEVEDLLVGVVLTADADSQADAGLRTVRLVDSTAADSMAVLTVAAGSTAEVGSTEAEAEDSTVVAVTVAAVTAADTGNRVD